MTSPKHRRVSLASQGPGAVRVIGGELRGRKLAFDGDPRTRPMKDRTRQALFNMLGARVAHTHALDLFAGTGVLAFEALSRGAARATLIEQHVPTAETLRKNAAALGLAARVGVVAGDAFHFVRRLAAGDLADDAPPTLRENPWLVFCSPPYDLYRQCPDDTRALIATLWTLARPGSVVVVEAPDDLPLDWLPAAGPWRPRPYPPAVLAVLEKPADPA